MGHTGLSAKGTKYKIWQAQRLEVGAQRAPKILALVYFLTSYLGE